MTSEDDTRRAPAAEHPSRDPAAMDEPGRREDATADGRHVYGEPRGPRPPHFTVLPGDEIERRARGGGPARASGRYGSDERVRDGFAGGMTTPESFETTGEGRPQVVRRALDGTRLPEDGPGRGTETRAEGRPAEIDGGGR